MSADIAALRLPYEALVFDLGGVIASHDNDVLLARVARHCPGPDASLRLVEILRGAAIGSGRETVATLHARLREQCGLALDWPAFAEIWCSHLGLDPAMLDFVEALAIHHRVMLFSNTNAEHWNFLVALSAGRLGRFEAYLSHELGLEKPSIEAFHAVAARAGIDAARSLFIDDIESNIEGARRAGFQAVQFTGQAAFERFLANSSN